MFEKTGMKSKHRWSLAACLCVGMCLAVQPACKDRDGGEPEREAAEGKPPAQAGDHDDDQEEEGGEANEVKLSPEAIAGSGVKLGRASHQALTPTLLAPARVAFNAEAMAYVGSPLSGRVAEVGVRLGDTVKAGDPMLVIESAELGEAQSDFIQKRVAAVSAGTVIEPLRNAYERGKVLYDKGQGISQAELQKRESDLRVAEAGLETARAAVTAANNKLVLLGLDEPSVEALAKTGTINPRMPVAAPISGQVVERAVTLGQLVGPEKESLLVLADMTRLWLLADVPEARLGDLAVGARAWVRVGASKDRIEGKVTFVPASLDPATRSAQVRIEVSGDHPALRPGAFAQAEIEIGRLADEQPKPVLTVPEEAVVQIENRSTVFVPVPQEENTFAARAVTVGEAVGDLIPVLGGLKDGDEVVVAGAFILKAELGKGEAGEDED